MGDAPFDTSFIVVGDEATARVVLDSDARKALREANAAGAPTLTCRGGMLAIETGAVTTPALQSLSELLARWHATPSPSPLLSEERART